MCMALHQVHMYTCTFGVLFHQVHMYTCTYDAPAHSHTNARFTPMPGFLSQCEYILEGYQQIICRVNGASRVSIVKALTSQPLLPADEWSGSSWFTFTGKAI